MMSKLSTNICNKRYEIISINVDTFSPYNIIINQVWIIALSRIRKYQTINWQIQVWKITVERNTPSTYNSEVMYRVQYSVINIQYSNVMYRVQYNTIYLHYSDVISIVTQCKFLTRLRTGHTHWTQPNLASH